MLKNTTWVLARTFIIIFTLQFLVAQPVQVKPEVAASIAKALQQVPNRFKSSSIIQDNEWRELQLDRLLSILDRTRTGFGSWGLRQFLIPIADIDEINHRQAIVQNLSQDDSVYQQLGTYLQKIASNQQALMSYWNGQDILNKQAQSFYFAIPKVKDRLNNSRLALEGAMLAELKSSVFALMQTLCLTGIMNEILVLACDGTRTFDLKEAIKNGLKGPLWQHWPWLDEYKKGYDQTLGSFLRIFIRGTFGDRYKVLSEGYNKTFFIKIPGISPVRTEARAFDSQNVSPAGQLFLKLFALCGASAYTAFYDISLGVQVNNLINRIVFLHKTSTTLNKRLVSVAAFIRNAKKLSSWLAQQEHLSSSHAAKELQRMFIDKASSKRLQQLISLLHTSTFNKTSRFFYSRGRMLLAHKILQEITEELVPMLQAIAEIDAFYSIATLYKQHSTHEAGFSFAEFISHESPLVDIDDCWTPLVTTATPVANAMKFGDTSPLKLIITGPNGCGKSTFLKALGHAIVLAQSWGIVPAQQARMTLFGGLRTCLASSEDLQQGLSTFMAEDKQMNSIENFLCSVGAEQKNIVLIDEPWRGTVDAASAEYIYGFGKRVAPAHNAVVCIATHVKQPIELASQTDNAFGNAQVEILEQEGRFEQTYKIKPGAAMWWFDDRERRFRFIEWLKTKYIS